MVEERLYRDFGAVFLIANRGFCPIQLPRVLFVHERSKIGILDHEYVWHCARPSGVSCYQQTQEAMDERPPSLRHSR